MIYIPDINPDTPVTLFDGLIINRKDNVKHMIVYNPEIIEVREVEKL